MSDGFKPLPKYKLKYHDKGVNIRITLKGFSKVSPISAKATAALLECLPSKHLEPIREIEYKNEFAKRRVNGFFKSTFKGAYYDYKKRKIMVYATDSSALFCHALFHEVGHAVFLHVLAASLRKKWVTKISGVKSKFFISLYAKRNAGEDFAESYSFYVNEPDLLREIPNKYKFFDRFVFENDSESVGGRTVKNSKGRIDFIA